MKSEIDFELIECCSCFVPFYVPTSYKKARMYDRQIFFCPHGHGQNFTGKNELELLKEKLSAAEKDNCLLRGILDKAKQQRDEAESKLKNTATPTNTEKPVEVKATSRCGRKKKSIITKDLPQTKEGLKAALRKDTEVSE